MKRSRGTLLGGIEISKPAENIYKLIDDAVTKISKQEPCPQCSILTKQLRETFIRIKKETDCLRDSSLISQAQFIEPSELFEDGKVPRPNARGAFGDVAHVNYLGQRVAVKINSRKNDPADFQSEIATLQAISHDNIVSFRGWGYTQNRVDEYLVMEHLDITLLAYVRQHHSHENRGLTPKVTWDISIQIVRAMVYLHSHGIVHGDLKPDNILIDADPIIPKPKICDFGQARHVIVAGEGKPKSHVRFRPPTQEHEEAKQFVDYKKFDVLSFGLVVLFMNTGELPYSGCKTDELEDRHAMMLLSALSSDGEEYSIRGTHLPSSQLFADLIIDCCGDAEARLLFPEIQQKYFAPEVTNPFNVNRYGDFFELGFLKNTYILVVDSIAGKYRDESRSRPIGYQRADLICEVDTGMTENRLKPMDETLRKEYIAHYREMQNKVKNGKLNEHVAVALTSVKPYNADGSVQRITLRFKDTNYSHHRAMRLVWKSMGVAKKKEQASELEQVHEIFSTSFGVHVAIITNEGEEKPGQFVFAKRTVVEEKPSPGMYTCGAVRGCKAEDYLSTKDVASRNGLSSSKTYLSLLKAAATGLQEEIGLKLDPSEWDAITFQTIYLKFDNHEWGIGGFVDLTHEKIQPKNSFSFTTLQSIFSSGTKGRHENIEIHGVDFDLRTMTEWIRKHHQAMASSAKIVAIKVMQAHFGINEVVKAFKEL